MLSSFIPRLNFNIPPPGFEYTDETFSLVAAPGVKPCSVPDAWDFFERHNIPPGMVRHAWARRRGGFENALAFDTNGDGDGVHPVPYTLEANTEDALKNAWTWYRRRAELSRRMKDAEWPAVLLWSEEEVKLGLTLPADLSVVEQLAGEAQKRGLVALSLFTAWAAGLRDTVEALLRYHRQNLDGWQEASVETPMTSLLGFVAPGHLVPSEPDPEARAVIRIELRAAIGTLQAILGQKPDPQHEQDTRRDLERITDKYRKIVSAQAQDLAAKQQVSLAHAARVMSLEETLEARCLEIGEAQMRIIALEGQRALDEKRIMDLEVQVHEAELETTRAAEFMDAIKAGADVMRRMEHAITLDDVVLWLRDEINTDESRAIAHDLEAIVDHLADVELTPPVVDCREAFKRGVASSVDALERHNAALMQWHSGAVADVRALCKVLGWPSEQVLADLTKPEFGKWHVKAENLRVLQLRVSEIVGCDPANEESLSALLDLHLHGLNGAWTTLDRNKQELERRYLMLMDRYHMLAARTEARADKLHGLVLGLAPSTDLGEAAVWWAETLGMFIVDPNENREGRYAVLSGAGGVRVELQKHAPSDVGRHVDVHFDIHADDVDAARDALIARGANLVRSVKTWHVMMAPTGHVFCVVPSENMPGPNPRSEAFDPLVVVVLDSNTTDANAIATAFGTSKPALCYGPIDMSELDGAIAVARAARVGVLVVSVPVAQSEKPRMTAQRAASYTKDTGSGYVYDVLICDHEIVRCRQAEDDPDILVIKRVLDRPRIESQASVTAWALDTFGECNPLRAAARAAEEMQEFIEVLDLELGVDCTDVDHIIGSIASKRELSAESRSRLLKEGADIITALWRFYSTAGDESAQDHVNAVMHTNRARLWLPDGTGCGYHVRIDNVGHRVYAVCRALSLSSTVEIKNDDKLAAINEAVEDIKRQFAASKAES